MTKPNMHVRVLSINEDAEWKGRVFFCEHCPSDRDITVLYGDVVLRLGYNCGCADALGINKEDANTYSKFA
jgi:hypothetical protein